MKIGITSFIAQVPDGQVIQIHALYPETEAQTKTFVMLFGRFFKKLVLKAADEIIHQDTNAIENSYKRSTPKIRLPNEEIMFYAEKLYQEW